MKFDIDGSIVKANGGQIENNFSYDDDTPITYRFSELLSHQLININPIKKDLIDTLMEFLFEALDSIQIIDKWSKNP